LAANEARLAEFEGQLADIETAFAKPEFYKDSEAVQATMEKHHQLKADIVQLTEEWEKLTLEAERVNGELAAVEEK
jgi:regulator of replication initiation timing